jgi:hypothetical protein
MKALEISANIFEADVKLSRRGFLKGASAGAAAVATTTPAQTVLKLAGDLAEKVGIDNLKILKGMTKIGSLDEIMDIARAFANSGISSDALTLEEIRVLERSLGEDWQEELDIRMDKNGTDYFTEVENIIGEPTLVTRLGEVLKKYHPDADVSIYDFFDQEQVWDAIQNLDMQAEKEKITGSDLTQAAKLAANISDPVQASPLRSAMALIWNYLNPKVKPGTSDVKLDQPPPEEPKALPAPSKDTVLDPNLEPNLDRLKDLAGVTVPRKP